MPTPKQLDRYSTIFGAFFIVMAMVMFWLPMFIDLKKDLLEMWWWPVGTLAIGMAAIFAREEFFKAIGSFFKRKADTL
jgi:hypothetical protein